MRFPVMTVTVVGLTFATVGVYHVMETHPPEMHERPLIAFPMPSDKSADAVPTIPEATRSCIANMDRLFPENRTRFNVPSMCECAAQQIARLHLTRRHLARPLDDPELTALNAVCSDKFRLRT